MVFACSFSLTAEAKPRRNEATRIFVATSLIITSSMTHLNEKKKKRLRDALK